MPDRRFPDIPNTLDLNIPSIFVDRYAARLVIPNVRLSFGEGLGSENDVRWSASVTLTASAIQDLSQMLRELLEENGMWQEPEQKAEAIGPGE